MIDKNKYGCQGKIMFLINIFQSIIGDTSCLNGYPKLGGLTLGGSW